MSPFSIGPLLFNEATSYRLAQRPEAVEAANVIGNPRAGDDLGANQLASSAGRAEGQALGAA